MGHLAYLEVKGGGKQHARKAVAVQTRSAVQ